jgi:hypothetical protein
MSLRRISMPGNLHAQPEARSSDTDGFEQCAMGYLAAKPIQVIQAVLTGIEAMHYNVELVKNLKAPRLSVIPAWRPPRDVQDALNHIRHLHTPPNFNLYGSEGYQMIISKNRLHGLIIMKMEKSASEATLLRSSA